MMPSNPLSQNPWTSKAMPGDFSAKGRHILVEPYLQERHAGSLFAAIGGAKNAQLWRYLPDECPDTPAALAAWLQRYHDHPCAPWRSMVLIDPSTERCLGVASYMRLRPQHGSAEIGAILFSEGLKRTIAASEAMFFMARHIFDDLGYRRYEWKCNTKNQTSMQAAVRLGFLPEGIFRNDQMAKGESRDTAWFAMTDQDWPQAKSAFEAWLCTDNFDSKGMQKRTLSEIRSHYSPSN